MSGRIPRRIAAAVLFVSILVVPPGCGSAEGAPSQETQPISAQDMHDRIYFLASDGLRGRDTPSPGLEAAAAYIVSEMRGEGLEPGGEDGTYYQRYPFFLRALEAEDVRLRVQGPSGQASLRFGRDFYVNGGTEQPITARVAVADPEGEASGAEGRFLLFSTSGSWDAAFRGLAAEQLRAALRAGAAGTIHLLDTTWTEGQVQQIAELAGRPAWALGAEMPFPQLFIRTEAAERAAREAGLAWEDVIAGEASGEVELHAPRPALEEAFPPNVAAVIRGSDPALRDEYVVLSAHMDHVGVGQPMDGDSIYNGADDNASGTSALLEVGRVLAARETAPARSILLLWVSGEEKGLLGSRWYSDHPTVPLESIVANINVDMIAGDQHADTVVVIGKDYSTLGPLVNEVSARHPGLGLVASDDLWPEQRFFYRSDHFNFARLEIPSIFFFTGVHECYHRPCDTVDFVDSGKAARVANLILHTTIEIADRPERPSWDPDGLAEVRALTR